MPDYRQTAIDAANYYGVPVDLFLAQIQQESGFNPNAVSPTGVRGIAQITQATAGDLGIDRNDPVQSLYGAAKYDAQLFRQFGSWALALAGYNAGPGNAAQYGTNFSAYPDPSQVSGYVSNILASAGGNLGGLNPITTAGQTQSGGLISGAGVDYGPGSDAFPIAPVVPKAHTGIKAFDDALNMGGDALNKAWATITGKTSNAVTSAKDTAAAVQDKLDIGAQVKDYLSNNSQGYVLGFIGIILIAAAIYVFARPAVEKVATTAAKIAA